MRRLSKLIFLFLTVGLLASCSTTTDFVIVNSSDEAIEVRYQFKNRNDIRYPAILSLADFKSHKEYQQLTEAGSQFELDDQTGTFTYRLAPKTVLLLDNVTNYFESEDKFRITRISIVGSKSSIDLTGREAQDNFKKLDSRNMGIIYN